MIRSSLKIYLRLIRNIRERKFRFAIYKIKYFYSSVIGKAFYYSFQFSIVFRFFIIQPPSSYSNVLKNIGIKEDYFYLLFSIFRFLKS